MSTDIAKALAFLQDLRRAYGDEGGAGSEWGAGASSSSTDPLTLSSGAVLSAYALRTIVTPSNVMLDAQSTKVRQPMLLGQGAATRRDCPAKLSMGHNCC